MKRSDVIFHMPHQCPFLANKATQQLSSKQSKNSSPWIHFHVPFSPITSAVLLGTNTKPFCLSLQQEHMTN